MKILLPLLLVLASAGAAQAADEDAALALAAYVQQLESDKELNQQARVEGMFEALMKMADLPPAAAAEPLLERHAADGYRLPGFLTDHGHRAPIMTHDTATAARFVLQQWQRQRARALAAAALAAGTALHYDGLGEAELAGYAQAFAAAPKAGLGAQRSGLAAALAGGARVEPLVLALVERFGDADLAARLVEYGRGELLVHMLPRINKALPAGAALPVLVAASAREDIGSAAVAEVGALSGVSHDAHAWLLKTLAEPRLGPSAAAALAGTGDPVVVAALVDTLRGADDRLARSRAALGLKLADTRAAREALRAFAADPASPPALRAQVGQWLD